MCELKAGAAAAISRAICPTLAAGRPLSASANSGVYCAYSARSSRMNVSNVGSLAGARGARNVLLLTLRRANYGAVIP
jgi:hypothetical protein